MRLGEGERAIPISTPASIQQPVGRSSFSLQTGEPHAVDSAFLRTAAEDLVNYQAFLQHLLDEAHEMVRQAGAVWQDEGYTEFNQVWHQLKDEVEKFETLQTAFVQTLERKAQQLDAARASEVR